VFPDPAGTRNAMADVAWNLPHAENRVPERDEIDCMALEVEHWNTAIDGELNEAALRDKLQHRGYHVTRYHYPPGTVFPDHTHGMDKIDAVLSGRFLMRMAGESAILEAGDCLAVPRGAVHSAEVVGRDTVVSLDAVRY
jgi:quercetin dioxygenase-like cupin family protein